MKFVRNFAVAAAVAMTVFGAASVHAEDKISEFRIGVLGGENQSDRMRSNECVRSKVEALLGVPTKIFAPADYNGVIEGLIGRNLDMAWLGASAYAKTYITDPEAVEPVLVKVNVDGSIGYHSIGFARVDSGITSLDDMKGKKFGFGDPNSTSGYLIPSIEIPAAGFPMESGKYFGEVVFTGGHEQTIVAVANGDIDAGVTWADGLGAWEEGCRCWPRRHDPAGSDLEVQGDPGRPGCAPQGSAVRRQGEGHRSDRRSRFPRSGMRLQLHGW